MRILARVQAISLRYAIASLMPRFDVRTLAPATCRYRALPSSVVSTKPRLFVSSWTATIFA